MDNVFLQAHNNILRLASWISQVNNESLKPFDISLYQFYVLRILYVNRPKAVTITDLQTKMLDKTSNVSRIVEKLLEKGWVDKEQDKVDKRKINVTLTAGGFQLIQSAIKVFENDTIGVMKTLSLEESQQLRDLTYKLKKENDR